ncbi:hypothetical protein FQN54_000307 [Arachnomyces sp. PD_36]|nr:hypothetical protein FQN54_000307 [Arachnomyces sp. PD_36]
MISLRNVLERLTLVNRPDADVEVEEKTIESGLLRLPTELILMIASSLPTPSAICLALCSRRLYYILGPGFWKSLHEEAPGVLLAFLSTLEKDLPQHFVCQQCTRLHRVSAVKWPHRITRFRTSLGPRCTRRTFNYRLLYLSRYEIRYPHVQLAIKQHCCGTDIGFPLKAFKHLEVKHDRHQEITLLSVDAQIVSNELLMRSQTWFLLPWQRRDRFICQVAEKPHRYSICLHTEIPRVLDRGLGPGLMRSSLDQLEAREKRSPEMMQCPYCWMDYTLQAIDFGERGFAIILTRWVNLGGGQDYADAKWQSHVTLPRARHPHHLGDIRTAYEEQAELSLKEFTADNEVKLFSRRRTRLVHRGSDGFTWKFDRYKRWYLAPSGPPETSLWRFLRGFEE